MHIEAVQEDLQTKYIAKLEWVKADPNNTRLQNASYLRLGQYHFGTVWQEENVWNVWYAYTRHYAFVNGIVEKLEVDSEEQAKRLVEKKVIQKIKKQIM